MCAVHSSPRTHMHKRTRARHRLAAVTRWPSNRCCEQCESRATPALHCCSTSSLLHGPHIQTRRATVPASPLPEPGHLSTWTLSKPCPSSLVLHLVSSTQRPSYRVIRPKHSQRLSFAISFLLLNSELCMYAYRALLIHLSPGCEFKSCHVNIDKLLS